MVGPILCKSVPAVLTRRMLDVVGGTQRTFPVQPLRSPEEGPKVGQGLFGQELRGVLNFCMHDQWG